MFLITNLSSHGEGKEEITQKNFRTMLKNIKKIQIYVKNCRKYQICVILFQIYVKHNFPQKNK